MGRCALWDRQATIRPSSAVPTADERRLARPLPGVTRLAIAPWIAPAVVAEYVHNAGVRLRRQFRGHTRHQGDALVDRARLHRGLLERAHVHGQSRALRHVLDARPVVLRAVAPAPRARRPRPRFPRRTRSTSGPDATATSPRPSTISTGRAMSTSTASTPCRSSWPPCAAQTRPTSWSAIGRGWSARSRTSTSASWIPRPVSSERTASSPRTATPSRTGRTPTATRWWRCWPRPSRRPAGSTRRSSRTSRATTGGC